MCEREEGKIVRERKRLRKRERERRERVRDRERERNRKNKMSNYIVERCWPFFTVISIFFLIAFVPHPNSSNLLFWFLTMSSCFCCTCCTVFLLNDRYFPIIHIRIRRFGF